MAFLLDTSVLLRLANTNDSAHAVAVRALAELRRHGEMLHITPQNLGEFRNVATRPRPVNGLGVSAPKAEGLAEDFEATFPLLTETPDIFPAWKSLVEAMGVVGKQVHDARLVAVCHVHGVSHLLTSNVAHFVRLAGFGPGVNVIDPASV